MIHTYTHFLSFENIRKRLTAYRLSPIFSAASRVPATALPSRSRVLETFSLLSRAKKGSFWRHVGAILEGRQHPFGSFWGHFGGSGRLWGAPWLLGALGPPPGWLRGASGTLLGSLLGPKMAPSWAQVGLKIGPRGFQDGSQNETSVGRPLECENGAQMGARSSKMRRKWKPNGP